MQAKWAVALAVVALLPVQAVAAPNKKLHTNGAPSALVSAKITLNLGEESGFEVISPDGISQGSLVIPAGQVLVVTDLHVYAPNSGTFQAQILNPGGQVRANAYFDTSVVGHVQYIPFTSGLVFSSRPQALHSGPTDAPLVVFLYGYFAKDR
jgi:hypothetical protein